MPQTMTAPVPAHNHRSTRLVDAATAEGQLNDALVETSRRSKRGSRSAHVLQLEKDIGDGDRRPFRHIVQMLFSAQDNDVGPDDIDLVARTLSGIMRTRAGLAPQVPLNATIRHEGGIESQLNPIQLAILDGEVSPENLIEARDLATQQIDALIAFRDQLNERIFACGLRMVAL